MKGLLFKWLALAVAVMAAAYVVDGIRVDGFVTALFAALTLGILNALFRPILLILTLPINVLTLGLFTFVINAMLLLMTSGLIGGLMVDGFGAALLGSLIISSVSWLLSLFVNNQGRIETMDIELRRRRDGRWE
ncbi:MAG: phage holin family protein [Desulfuromonadales bacterium]|nr:phage holin family protein [Desulfuromonadales bacterium]MBN2790907.1 phage holin family protein [Desulfuromonadales bacterium]